MIRAALAQRLPSARHGKSIDLVGDEGIDHLRREGMAEIEVKELKATASGVIDEVEGGAAYVVTKGGRPAAVLLPVEEAEDLVLANAEEYVRMRRLAQAAYTKGLTTKLKELD
jgi:prevent-host-death family protein